MDKPITFSEWLGTQGNMVLLHANCCRIAYEAGQQSQQAKVEELQKQLTDQGQRFNEQAQVVKDLEHKVKCEREISLFADKLCCELQKRVDAALGHLDDVNFPPDYEDAWESFYKAEQALKGEG
ncbi:hypothetical protein [Acinetobacter baumannii]|uniref:hypothetical protein n=1 Tax=Acinetobacter baumannii TaxID=470 RepID=UPI0025A0B98C|nr:hypothetical protein [Acinetobacter baumannii]HAV4999695.1 hypothetical protein [Acinetobacter baumannii]HAV5029398.1 hypothetical protein [Acinetobacter baumannii]